MATRQTTKEKQEGEQAFAAEPSMPSAPDGSAERVKDDADLDFDTGQPVGDSVGPDDPEDPVVDPGEERTILANGYNAEGEAEAVRVPVTPAAQPSMPGFEKPELWDRFEGRKVNKVILTFAGTCDLSQDPALCTQLRLRNEVDFSISGEVTGKAFKLRTDKNGVTTVDGVATINVTEVAEEGRDLDAVREAAYNEALYAYRSEATELLSLVAHGRTPTDEDWERLTAFLESLAGDQDVDDDEPSALEASLAEAGVG